MSGDIPFYPDYKIEIPITKYDGGLHFQFTSDIQHKMLSRPQRQWYLMAVAKGSHFFWTGSNSSSNDYDKPKNTEIFNPETITLNKDMWFWARGSNGNYNVSDVKLYAVPVLQMGGVNSPAIYRFIAILSHLRNEVVTC